MPLPFVRIDAFTAEPFAGNPAAVCVLPEDRDAAWMQLVAQGNDVAGEYLIRCDRAPAELLSRWKDGSPDFLAKLSALSAPSAD